jgi:hypothetical protein
MKKIVLVLALVLVPGVVSAQVMLPAVLEVSATGGASLPTGSLNETFDTGYNLGGQAAFYFMPQLAVGANAMYHSFSDKAVIDSTIIDVDLTIWEITAFAKYQLIPSPLIAPYAKVSAGVFYNEIRGSLGDISVPLDATEFGIGAGLGAQVKLRGSTGLFVEGMYLIDFTDEETTKFISLRGGLNFYIKPRPRVN